MDAVEKNYCDQLRTLVNEAEDHHRSACEAAEKGDTKALTAAHGRMGRCIRSMQVTFRNMGKAGAAADQAATSTIQTSSGTAKSDGSANGRAATPVRTTPGLLTNDPKIWLDRARIGGRR